MTSGPPPPPPNPESPPNLGDLLAEVAYAGVGLAQTARSQFPEMVERGRVTVQRRTQVLQMMSRFALAQGQREAIRRLTRFEQEMQRQLADLQAEKDREASEAIRRDLESEVARLEEERTELLRAVEIARAATAKAKGDPRPEGVIDVESEVMEDEVVPRARRAATRRPSSGPTPRVTPSGPAGPSAGAPVEAEPDPGGPVDARDLAIPGYDSLSASQVVPRLASLTPEELRLVIRYEQANRGRRTILNRARDLAVG